MPELTRERADEYLKRIESIPDDAAPNWGTLRKDTLIQHLIWAFRESMNPNSKLTFTGNFVMVNIVGPLLIRGMLSIPKNVKFKDGKGGEVNTLMPGDMNDLRETVYEFVETRENGTLKTSRHPRFGDLGPRGWSMMHVRHTEHHLKQFGA